MKIDYARVAESDVGLVTSAATTSITAVTATASPAAATTTATLLTRTSFIDRQRATITLLPVEPLNGGLGFLVAAHFHKPESLAPPGVTVGDDLGAGNGAESRE
jgi:hypothetical protein